MTEDTWRVDFGVAAEQEGGAARQTNTSTTPQPHKHQPTHLSRLHAPLTRLQRRCVCRNCPRLVVGQVSRMPRPSAEPVRWHLGCSQLRAHEMRAEGGHVRVWQGEDMCGCGEVCGIKHRALKELYQTSKGTRKETPRQGERQQHKRCCWGAAVETGEDGGGEGGRRVCGVASGAWCA